MNPASRHTKLFEAYKNTVRFDGPGWFRKQKTMATRLRTQVITLTGTCDVVLDDSEKATLRAAATLLLKLTGDFEIATRDAVRFAAQLEAQRAAEREVRLQQIETDYIGTIDQTTVADYLRDIASLCRARPEELRAVFGHSAPDYVGVVMRSDMPALIEAASSDSPFDLHKAARSIALWLEHELYELHNGGSLRLSFWQIWRAHRARLYRLQRSSVFSPNEDA
jgi:hypothetical protein